MRKPIILSFIFLQAFHLAFGQNLAAQLNTIASNNDMMGGAVVVFCESGIIDSYYFGKSDYQRNFNIQEQTKFRIASISKTITAIAIMQLAEQNLLDIDAGISSVLGYNVINPNSPSLTITPRMLLSHTSTIIDGPTYSSFMNSTINDNPIPNLSELLTTTGSFYAASQFNNTVPGNYFNYSNINYVILGTIVEKISNLRFDAYCLQNIFQPLGLDASFNVNDLQNIDSLAVLYRKISGIWTPQADDFQGIQPVYAGLTGYIPGTNGGKFGPQGGLRCSAKDLATLFMCLNSTAFCAAPILNASTIAAMRAQNWAYNGTNGNNYTGLFLSWGLGIHRVTSTTGNDIVLPGSASMYGHTGEAYGLVSDAYFDTTRSVGIVFITNGVGTGYQTNNYSAFYTVEQEVFNAIETYGNLQSCITLKVDSEVLKNNNFTIYPNPAKETIIVQTKETDAFIELYNVLGERVYVAKVEGNNNVIDISQFKNGLYSAVVSSKGHYGFEKFLIAH